MDEDDSYRKQDRQIMDQSLKRAFAAEANGDLPDVFKSLLGKLAECDKRDNGVRN